MGSHTSRVAQARDAAVEDAWARFCESWPSVAETTSARALFLRWLEPVLIERNNYRSKLQQIADGMGERLPSPLCDRCGGNHYITEHDEATGA